MGISVSIMAKCRECSCVFNCYIDNFPFIDGEIIGICDRCVAKESHDCYDEFWEEDGTFKKIGKKEF